MSEKYFDESDLGCWIDSAYGETHAAEKMAEMLRDLDPDFADEFASLDADEAFQAMDEAQEILQEHTADGLVWLWEAGDLILTTEDQAD